LDVPAAREKIARAKKELIAAGAIEPDEEIPPLTLEMPGRDDHYRRVGQFAKGEFRKVGITLNIELNDWPTLQEKVNNKQAQMYAMGLHAHYPDAENFLQLYYSPNIELGTNNVNYRNERFDRLYRQADRLGTEQQRVPLYAQMARMLSEDCPVLLLSEPITYALIHKWVHNYKNHPLAYGLAKYTRIDVEVRRAAEGGR